MSNVEAPPFPLKNTWLRAAFLDAEGNRIHPDSIDCSRVAKNIADNLRLIVGGKAEEIVESLRQERTYKIYKGVDLISIRYGESFGITVGRMNKDMDHPDVVLMSGIAVAELAEDKRELLVSSVIAHAEREQISVEHRRLLEAFALPNLAKGGLNRQRVKAIELYVQDDLQGASETYARSSQRTRTVLG